MGVSAGDLSAGDLSAGDLSAGGGLAGPMPLLKISTQRPIAVVGGGLAGLAAASALAERGWPVVLFEARQQLGGRASSFVDPGTGELLDNCQHVGMGCCTNLQKFCRTVGIEGGFRRERTLYFIGPDGRECRFQPSSWLPAPLHLGPALWSQSYLSVWDRLGIARALWRLARLQRDSPEMQLPMNTWLDQQRQSATACRRFWTVVLVSALSETLDRIAVSQARKVFVDGFMAHRQAYQVDIPQQPLGVLYGTDLERWLGQMGVRLHAGSRIKSVDRDGSEQFRICNGQETMTVGAVILALPWRQAASILGQDLRLRVPELAPAAQLQGAPITSVHLWVDRPITSRQHVVLVDRTSQWLFNRGEVPSVDGTGPNQWYYQVVISASRDLSGRDRQQVANEVMDELRAIWQNASAARLIRWQMVTERFAVFSPLPGADELRPCQRLPVAGLYVAGDWTQTGWPATMEGAVRGGYLAAEALLADAGCPERLVAEDLPRAALVRWLFP